VLSFGIMKLANIEGAIVLYVFEILLILSLVCIVLESTRFCS
jgi:hypothetical protein